MNSYFRASRAPLAIRVLLVMAIAAAEASAAQLSWIRLLIGDAEPIVWRAGQARPVGPDGLAPPPASVLSYTRLKPGLEYRDGALESLAARFERALGESGRFDKAVVYLVQTDGSSRGLIVEVEARSIPGFGGGAAYASVHVPLAGSGRGDLNAELGANRAGISYADGLVGGSPLVLGAGLEYRNDLLESGPISRHELTAKAAIGLRLGPLSSLTLGPRVYLDGSPAAEPSALLAADADASTTFLGVGAFPVDASVNLAAGAYPMQAASRLLALGSLRLGRAVRPGGGPTNLTLRAGAGYATYGTPESQLFSASDGSLRVRGPDSEGTTSDRLVYGSLEWEAKAVEFQPLSWVAATLGPFAFVDLAWVGGLGEGRAVRGIGGGLRMALGDPIGIRVDLGYALGGSGAGALEFAVGLTTTMR